MKILVVCQYYKPEPFRIADICEGLVQAGHEVHVVTGTPNYPEGEIYPGYEGGDHRHEVVNGVTVHRCPIHPRKRGALHRFWNYYSFVFASDRYLRTVEEDFDVVFVNQLSPVMMAESALRYAKKHGKKTVLYCLDLWPESLTAGGIRSGSLIYRLFFGISRRIYRTADEILVTSQGFLPYFRDVLGLDTEKIHYLPQYAEGFFSEIPPVTAHDGPYHFLFAGNIGEMQSVDTILAAARELEHSAPIHIDIVGDGSDLRRCRELAKGLTNVTFHGRHDVGEMPAFYASADAMLVTLKNEPSLSQTLPGKVQSYMASGRAVVGAINGETSAVIAAADCGVCVPAEDAHALAQAMRELAAQPEAFARYGRNGKQFYQQYFRKEAFLSALTEVLGRNAAC